MYGTGPNINSNQTLDRLDADMVLNYQDGTGETVLFGVSYSFAQGGMDLSTHQVLNWSKVVDAGLTLLNNAVVNGTSLGTMYTFMGFDVVNGTASQFSLTKNYPNGSDPNSFSYSVNNIVGSINYANATSIQIGAVNLSTANTTSNGKTMTVSIAKFNVTVDALMSNLSLPPTSPGVQQNANSSNDIVPVVLMFQVTHDTVQTEIKYGVSVDWSNSNAFPTATIKSTNLPNPPSLIPGALKDGDNFSLVAADRLSFGYGRANGANTTYTYATTFTTDSQNDSAIYLVNGTQLCRELFPTSYSINENPKVINTTRDYVPVSFQSTWNESSMFIVYGGFKYNESTGFTFDPVVITPNSVSSNTVSTSSHLKTTNGPNEPNWLQVLIPVGLVITVAIAATMIMLRRRSGMK
jgi:hypothetical protein